MSILIKGMEIPSSPVLFCMHPDGKVFADLEGGWKEYKATELPPHGRLIDADALAETHGTMAYENGGRSYSFHTVAKAWLEDAPTIIEAEEDE